MQSFYACTIDPSTTFQLYHWKCEKIFHLALQLCLFPFLNWLVIIAKHGFKECESLVNLLLYIPCMLAIWKNIRGHQCYKIIFYKGLLDMPNLVLFGALDGWFSITGAVYCTHPTFFCIKGCFLIGQYNYHQCKHFII